MGSVAKGPVDWEMIVDNRGSTDQMDWRKRTIAIRKLLGDDIRSVIDVGAGSMFLSRLLSPEVRYYPVSYERHCDEALVCDLNAYQFPNIKVDAAVLTEILDYLNDVDWLFDILAERVSMIVLSYKGKEGGFEQSRYSSDELITKLRQRGFILTGWDKEFKEWPLLARFQKAQPQLLAANYFCTGCGACANSCKAGVIELRPDFQGFLKPQINAAKCVGCNRCVEVCPSAYLHKNDHFTEPDCYAAWAQDDIRKDSTSGGVFTVLAQSIIGEGGIVFGAAWTEDFHLEHIGIRDIEELPKLRHSKYVQSNTKDTFRQVKEILEGGSPVLYVGTPCQIAGLHSFLGKPYAELYTVDLICFCSGGPANAFRKYLAEQYGIENVQNVVFRDKYRGWWADGYSIHKEDGSVLQFSIDTDDYQKAYHNVLLRNKTCEDCIYADFPRQGDITLGDFWGIDQHDPSWNDGKGTSIILVNSEKGQHMLDAVKADFLRIEQVPLKWARGKGNRIGKDGRPRHKRAEDFLTNLDKHTFRESLDTALIDKHDIGLVCLHNDNYGNNLTNYALYQYLNDCGYSVAMIDQTLDAPLTPQAKRLSLFGHIPYKIYDLFPNAENKVQLKKANDQCDIFIVGSDQLFRASFSQDMDMHPCMDWVASNKPKISYATSFGVEYFEGTSKLIAKMRYYLKRFQAISVREESGIDILKQTFGIDNGICVLDPVFLCEKSNYEDMAQFGKMRFPKGAYLGGYILDRSEKKAALIERAAKENGISEIRIIGDGDRAIVEMDESSPWNKWVLTYPLVEEWLANIAYSDVFITDSFHGACFALIFEKDFWIVTDDSCWRGGERLHNLVSMLGIEDRLIRESADFSDIDLTKHINYSEVNQKLKLRLEESMAWLSNALEHAKTFSGDYETFDILSERIDYLQGAGKMLEDMMRNSTAYLEGILKEGLGKSQDSERENWQQVQELIAKRAVEGKQFESHLENLSIQIQTVLKEEMDKRRENELASWQQMQNLLDKEIQKGEDIKQKLELALREKAELEAKIVLMCQSNSWKITRPLRKISSMVRLLIDKIKSKF